MTIPCKCQLKTVLFVLHFKIILKWLYACQCINVFSERESNIQTEYLGCIK